MEKKNVTRRNFLKTGVVSSAALAEVSTLTSCSTNTGFEQKAPFPLFLGENYSPEDGITGLSFSQVGYEPDLPVRVIVRLPKKELLPETASCILTPAFRKKES